LLELRLRLLCLAQFWTLRSSAWREDWLEAGIIK